MPFSHVRDLFSAAYDDELSANQTLDFNAHLASCAPCAREYEAFRAAVDGVRGMPPARMPLPVHLPSAPPGAERSTAAAWLRGLRRRLLVPGGATAVAAVAAAAIVVVALTHQSGSPTSSSLGASSRSAGAAGGGGLATAQAGCPVAAASEPAQAPAGYAYQTTKTDPSRPGQELVLATTGSTVSSGGLVSVYASLSVPQAAAGLPGAAAPVPRAAVTPCITLSGLPAPEQFGPVGVPAHGAGSDNPVPASSASRALSLAPATPVETFQIPPGTPPGTVVHIIATIPAGYPTPGEPAMTVDLAITVR